MIIIVFYTFLLQRSDHHHLPRPGEREQRTENEKREKYCPARVLIT